MPWKVKDIVTERNEMMLEWKRQRDRGEVNFAALCREYGVSRKSGYKWLKRFTDAGESLKVLGDTSRRPRRTPTRTPKSMEQLIVSARKKNPAWGPRKLLGWLRRRRPKLGPKLPKRSTVDNILRRHGLTNKRIKSRRKTPPYTQPFATCTAPNMVWCTDFKGWFHSADGLRVYPLTITDAHTRFIIRCVPLLETDAGEVIKIFKSAFRQYGLPNAIRTDNGPPFATRAAAGLGELNVWWIRLGINHERIDKGKPQQNGRHERMHRSIEDERGELWRELNWPQLPAACRSWVKEFNFERPHEALGDDVPADHYAPSSRCYPRPPEIFHNHTFENAIVDEYGHIYLSGRQVSLPPALVGEVIDLQPYDSFDVWLLSWRNIKLGVFDLRTPKKGLMGVPGRRPSVPYFPFEARRPQANVYVSKQDRERKKQRVTTQTDHGAGGFAPCDPAEV